MDPEKLDDVIESLKEGTAQRLEYSDVHPLVSSALSERALEAARSAFENAQDVDEESLAQLISVYVAGYSQGWLDLSQIHTSEN
ncbi:MAG: hypothetical protein ABEK03_08725 [Candidatus Bipolaricaulia bacterium]